MLKKRLIGVVTVKNGWAVQSFGYNRYMPLGKPECLVENLDRWGADEILVQVIDRSLTKSGPDFELLSKLAQLGLGTPLIYGGGIRTIEESVQVINTGADRVIVDSLLHENLSLVKGMGEQLGAQALIVSIPMSMCSGSLEWFNYKTKKSVPLSDSLLEIIEKGDISEVLLTDWQHEGNLSSFDSRLIEKFPVNNIQLIAFGGISDTQQMRDLYSYPNVSAISLGNFLSYRENAIQIYKDDLASSLLRPSTYATEYSLQFDV